MLTALVKNWWIAAVRGGLGILLGLMLLLLPRVGLGEVVALFGAYAVLDGLCAVVSAVRISRVPLEAWPVGLEGVVSIALGVVALAAPFEAAGFVRVIAIWGLVTGILEIVAAMRVPRVVEGHWLLATGGVWSIFLALLLLGLPHAVTDYLVKAIGVYAVVFGALVALAAFMFWRVVRRETASG